MQKLGIFIGKPQKQEKRLLTWKSWSLVGEDRNGEEAPWKGKTWRERVKGEEGNGFFFFWLLKLETHKSRIYDHLLIFLSVCVPTTWLRLVPLFILYSYKIKTLALFYFNTHTATCLITSGADGWWAFVGYTFTFASFRRYLLGWRIKSYSAKALGLVCELRSKRIPASIRVLCYYWSQDLFLFGHLLWPNSKTLVWIFSFVNYFSVIFILNFSTQILKITLF